MRRTLLLLFVIVFATAESIEDLDNKDLQPEETQRRIRDIIRSHEEYKYGQHGGHEADDIPQKDDRKGDYAPEYQVHYKNGPGHKGQGYIVVPSRKPYGLSRKLKPVNSKIYSYYPNIDPKEGYDGSTKSLVYYPEKKPDVYESYPEQKDETYSNHGAYVVPEAEHHDHYPEQEPHVPQGSYAGPHVDHHHYSGANHPHPVAYAPVEHKYDPPVSEHKAKYIGYIAPPEHAVASPDLHVTDNHHHAAHKHKELGYKDHGYGYHGDHGEEKAQDHHHHKEHDEAGHKSHAAHAAHNDHHSKYHNKGSYERDRGYHYEKSYAYDRIRANHDIGKSHDSHAAYKGQHSHQDHHKKAKHGGHTFMYFKKGNNHGDHGYGKSGHYSEKDGHFKKGHNYRSEVLPTHSHYR